MLGTRSRRMMKLACPPERWTPKGEDPEEHYKALLKFYKQHYSSRTIYNTFWSTDNYSMPDPVPKVDTKIEYWYDEEEKRSRKKEHDIEFVCRTYPQTVLKEFKGLAHAELELDVSGAVCLRSKKVSGGSQMNAAHRVSLAFSLFKKHSCVYFVLL